MCCAGREDHGLSHRAGACAALVIAGMLVASGIRRTIVGTDPPTRFRDFYEFYSAAAALHDGGTAGDVFSAGFLGYIYPPLLATLLDPLVSLGIEHAAIVWLVVNALVLLTAVHLLSRAVADAFGRPWSASLLGAGAMLVLLDKLFAEFKMQQCDSFLLLGWGVAMRWGGKRPGLTGLALGFAANLKYTSALAIPHLLVRRSSGGWKTAACVVAGIVFWALAPAMVIGWARTHDLWVGALAGLSHAVGGCEAPTGVAHIMPMNRFGVSITTSVLSLTTRLGEPWLAVPVLALLATLLLMYCRVLYRRAGLSLFRDGLRAPSRETNPPRMRQLALVEWTGLIAAILAFSPQTNARHLVQLLPGVMVMLALVAWGAPRARCCALIGLTLTTLGIVLPPSYGDFNALIPSWHAAGGPCWCALASWLLVLWGVLPPVPLQPPALQDAPSSVSHS